MNTASFYTWIKRLLPSIAVTQLKHYRQGIQRFIRPANAARSVEPISRVHGVDRGEPIDRYYINKFLTEHSSDIRGHVLEIGDRTYTTQYGSDRVRQSSVLHVAPGNGEATIVGDLQTGAGLPDNAFDCIILTQTLPFIFDIFSAARHLHRALAPGGVALITASGIAPICRYDMDRWGDYWRFTSASLRRLLETAFDPAAINVNTYGNVLSSVAFLQGLSKDELTSAELEHRDDDYQLLVVARAVKTAAAT